MTQTIPTSDAAVNINQFIGNDERSFWRRRAHQGITSMCGMILQRLGYPSGKQRDFIDAVQSARGGGEDLKEPNAVFRRSHENLAQYMQTKGDNEKARSQCVSRCLKRHENWQRRNGILLIEIFRSTRTDESTGYRDYLTPISDQAMQLALSDPDFRRDRGRESIQRALAKAVDWAVQQFPQIDLEGEDDAEGIEANQMGMDEYIDFTRRRIKDAVAKAIETVENRYSSSTAGIRLARELARDVDRVADSMAKTQGARRMPIIEARERGEAGSGSICGNDFDENEFPDDYDLPPDSGVSIEQTVDRIPVTPIRCNNDQNRDLFPDELSYEASDEANWGEELTSDNDIQKGNESLSTAPLTDETTVQEVHPNENDEDLPPLSEMGQAALEYACLGYFVVPNHWPVMEDGNARCSCRKAEKCPKPAKHPLWHPELMPDGINSASNDPAIVRQWWMVWPKANIAFECSERSGVFAHDFDEEEGRALFEEKRADGETKDAVIQRTGGGGFHVLSRYERIEGLSNWCKPDGAPFDVRGAKKAAQVIVSPSRHISGAAYEWLTDYRTLAPMSAGLRALLVDAVEQMRALRSAAVGARTPTGISKRTTGTLSVIYPEGERNNQLHAYASWLRGVRGFDVMEIFEELRARNQEACVPPLDDDEVRKIAGSAARYVPAVVVRTNHLLEGID